MKKVIYSITKLGKTENKKITGVGYVTDDELITANVSKNGSPTFEFSNVSRIVIP